jgi:hypothetical protein
VVLDIDGRRKIYSISNIMIIACVTLLSVQSMRIYMFKNVIQLPDLATGRSEVVFIFSLTMYVEIPLGVLYIVLSAAMS